MWRIAIAWLVLAGVTYGQLPLYPQQQPHPQTLDWPTHAAVAFAPGQLVPSRQIHLRQNSVATLADLVPVTHWPDGSVKWLHVHALFKYINGQGATCDLASGENDAPSPLQVTEDKLGIKINTGTHQFTVPKPFKGPGLVDARGIAWASDYDPTGTVHVEYLGKAHTVICAKGWYQSAEKRVAPFCQYTTRIVAYAGSNLVRIDHATTFCDDMRKHAIAQCGFDTSLLDTTARSAIVERDPGKKAPMRAVGTTYWQWPPDLKPPTNLADDLRPQNLHKFRYLEQGPLFSQVMPEAYYLALKASPETYECKPEFARAANFQGVSWHSRFLWVLGTADLAALQGVFQVDPVAVAGSAQIAKSGALGLIGDTNGWPQMEQLVTEALLGYARQNERYEERSWLLYGNSHHAEIMSEGRPNLHRVSNNNHYQQLSILWTAAARTGDRRLYAAARRATDFYASIGVCRFDRLEGYVTGDGTLRAGVPQTKFHWPGGMWHCKGLLPVGGRDWGMDSNDIDCNTTGHWIDPSGLLLAWLLDADYWARDGYELWHNAALPAGGRKRDANTTLSHMIQLYEYAPNPELLTKIRSLATDLRGAHLADQQPGPLWEPTWLSRYVNLCPDDKPFQDWLLTELPSVSPGYEGIYSMAMSATAARITGEKKYLQQFGGILNRAPKSIIRGTGTAWDGYGMSPGPGSDGHLLLQWPWFKAALQEHALGELPGTPRDCYPAGYSGWDVQESLRRKYATKIVILKPADNAPLRLNVDTATGSVFSIFVYRGERLLFEKQRAEQQAKWRWRDDTFSVWRVECDVPDSAGEGLYEVFVTGNAHVYQGLSEHPEALVMHVREQPGASGSYYTMFAASGLVLPLSSRPITLNWRVAGEGAGYVAGKWRPTGQTASETLAPGSPAAGPRRVDWHAQGLLWLDLAADVQEPFLFGSDPASLQQIANALRKGKR